MSAAPGLAARAARSLIRALLIVGLSTGAGAAYVRLRFPELRWIPDPHSITSDPTRKARISITAEELRALIDAAEQGTMQVAVIDARPREEFLKGHVAAPTILNVYGDECFDYDTRALELVRDYRIVLYCTSRQCDLADLVYDMLVNEYGFADVVIYPDGWHGWQAAGLAVDAGPEMLMGVPLEVLMGDAPGEAPPPGNAADAPDGTPIDPANLPPDPPENPSNLADAPPDQPETPPPADGGPP